MPRHTIIKSLLERSDERHASPANKSASLSRARSQRREGLRLDNTASVGLYTVPMSVPYYIGAKAIAERLGYKNTKTVLRLIERTGLPVYLRYVPTRTGKIRKYCISESALTAWELVQGQQNVNRIKVKRVQQAEQKKYALTL